jgi:hypothetical protein
MVLMIGELIWAKLHPKYLSMLLVIMESNFCFLTVMYLYQRGIPARASVSMISTQDPAQSQALFNIRDSNKVSYHLVLQHLLFVYKAHIGVHIFQEERERRVLVRKFKFEEPRREQIDELKVCLGPFSIFCKLVLSKHMLLLLLIFFSVAFLFVNFLQSDCILYA